MSEEINEALIRLLIANDFNIFKCYYNDGKYYMILSYAQGHSFKVKSHENFTEAFMGLINEAWNILNEDIKQQIKELL